MSKPIGIKERILALRKEGKSYKQICAIVGCSIGSVGFHCTRNGLALDRAITHKKPNLCLVCKNPTKRNRIYCSRQCRTIRERSFVFMKIDAGVFVARSHSTTNEALRRYLTEKRGYKCEWCKCSDWGGDPIVLQVDHIDGNSENHKPTNIRLLCPNCHSQTKNYCGKNRGNGKARTKYR